MNKEKLWYKSDLNLKIMIHSHKSIGNRDYQASQYFAEPEAEPKPDYNRLDWI